MALILRYFFFMLPLRFFEERREKEFVALNCLHAVDPVVDSLLRSAVQEAG